MSWLVFCLSVFVALGGFGDFLLGKSGDRGIRAALADFYVNTSGNWHAAYQLPAMYVYRFIFAVLGKKAPTIAVRTAAYSSILAAAVGAHILIRLYQFDDVIDPNGASVGKMFYVFISLYAIPNTIGDMIAWTATIVLLKQISRSPPWRALLLALCALLIAGLSVYVTLLAQGPFVNFLSISPQFAPGNFGHYATNIGGYALQMLGADLGMRRWDSMMVNYVGEVPFLVAIPLVLFAVTTGVGALLCLLQPVLRTPLMLILERLDEQPRGILTVCTAAFSISAGLIAEAMKAAHLGA